MNVLVTGATGLIGSFLCEALVRRGDKVAILARRQSDLSILEGLPLDVRYGDLRDEASLRAAVKGADVVIHTAARMSDWGPTKDFWEDNVYGTQRLMDACLLEGVKRFVHTSSTGVLGLKAHMDAREDEPLVGEGDYEETKVAAEQAVMRWHREKGLAATVVRPSWTLGPRARRHIPLLLNYLRQGTLMVIGSGRNVLTFVDPRDAAEGLILAATSPRAVGEIYQLTNGSRTNTQGECYRILAEELGVRPPRIHVPYVVAFAGSWVMEAVARLLRFEDAPLSTPIRVKFLGRTRHYSMEKARRELGYEPRYDLRQSLRDAVAWWRSTNEARAWVPKAGLAPGAPAPSA